MKDFPKSKTIIIIFSVIFVIALSVIIPLSLMQKNIKKEVILNKNNFETYFNVKLSYSQVNSYGTIKYEITPKSDYYEKNETSQTINLTIAVKFDKYYAGLGNGAKTEYIYLKLLKNKKFEIKGSQSVKIPEDATDYDYYLSSVTGNIII